MWPRPSLRFPVVPLLILAASSSVAAQEGEIAQALEYLNRVRQNPAAFSTEIGVNLRNIAPRPQLTWNESLANAAQSKAEDMAKRNYFRHTAPGGRGINIMIHEAGYRLVDAFLDNPARNNFESITAGHDEGEAAIMSLITSRGHRRHLLGLSEFWANALDIGIGFAENPGSRYRYYWVVVIAKHDF